MKAAVIRSFGKPPSYEDFSEPLPRGPEEIRVQVLAAGLHHLTRARADGSHYTSAQTLPMVPGVDGVGRGPDGKLRYFVVDGGQIGSMAEETVVEIDHSLVLPRDCDPVTVAAAMNPAMGSWLALRCRVPFKKRQKVLILGATGNAGSMAVQVARHLGAAQIIAVGRDQQRLAKLGALGATDLVSLGDARLGALAREVDVVLDFIWGESSAQTLELLVRDRADRARPLTWIEVGSVGGQTAAIPASALRASRLEILGSGIGSVPGREILKELPALVKEITRGTFRIDAKAVPLRAVEQAWCEAAHMSERVVFTP
ncbi:MAG TPA: zinc-binding alcohol dehydrogenase family protein [Polyangiaceae bacterium]|nr:zinc-binding alcohol dehydrogenase family protein [Polyangiaceae bacterium]